MKAVILEMPEEWLDERHRLGGTAAQFSVPNLITYDVDFTPATDRDNLDRLSAALTELGVRIRTTAVPEGLPFAHDGSSLGRAKMWNLQCAHGAIDHLRTLRRRL